MMTQSDKPFILVDISDNYELKYDGYRDRDHWTLLKKGGGRIFDGRFIDVINYLERYRRECRVCGNMELDYATKQIGWKQIGTPYNPCWQPTYEHECMQCIRQNELDYERSGGI